MPPLLLKLVFQRLPQGPCRPCCARWCAPSPTRAQSSFIDPQLETHLELLGERARPRPPGSPVADFTAADIQMSFPLEAAEARAGVPLGANAQGFLARIRARPAYARALAAGGPFELPGASPATPATPRH